ncbi:MAG: response regulator transcription factor [Waterburya sp.]
MIKLLLVDDQDIFRQGLAALLTTEADLEVVAQASNGKQAIAKAEKLQPDVILMDIQMPICDGVTATREICRRYPWMRILVLTTFDDDEYIGQSLQAGAKGYLLKRKPAEEMAMAIRAVNYGYAQLSPEVAPKVFAQIQPIDSANARYIDILSSRELEVLQLVGHGKNNREISTTLHLSIGTVKNYISQILQKLELRDRIAAALWARENLR